MIIQRRNAGNRHGFPGTIIKHVFTAVLVAAFLWTNDAAAGGKEFIKPANKDKCPVCGMFAAKYPDWNAEVVFRDSDYLIFDGPKDLFKFIADQKTYLPDRRQTDIEAVYVTDYYAIRPIDGFTAFYVQGSDVRGPMGAELIPFEKETDAREFVKDHGGKRILRFKDITTVVLKGVE